MGNVKSRLAALGAMSAIGAAMVVVNAAPASAAVWQHTNWAYTKDSGGAGGRARIEIFKSRGGKWGGNYTRLTKLVVLDRDGNDHKVAYASLWTKNRNGKWAMVTTNAPGDAPRYWRMWDDSKHGDQGKDYSSLGYYYTSGRTIKARVCLVNKVLQTSGAKYCSWTTQIRVP